MPCSTGATGIRLPLHRFTYVAWAVYATSTAPGKRARTSQTIGAFDGAPGRAVLSRLADVDA
ncbi:hypothetical protein [Sphaerobacter thermophilus]|uniref:hypothetical protein n=1 Tax=Sphaerobacter thermophilus TaxID=2057 RepID=UPI0039C46F2F